MATPSGGRWHGCGWLVLAATVLGAGLFLAAFAAATEAPIREGQGALATARAELGPTPAPAVAAARAAVESGQADYRDGRYAAALAHFEEALRLQPDDADAWAGLGWTYLRLQRRAEARDAFERALALSPGLTSARAGLDALGPVASPGR